MKPYFVLVARDLRLMAGRGPEILAALVFFAIVAALFSFAFGADPILLAWAAPGVLWVAALLSSLLALEAVYQRDYDDGTFDLLLLAPVAPAGIALAKMASHWLLSGFPLVLLSFIVAPMMGLSFAVTSVLALSLLPGTLYLSLLGGAGAALALGARRSGLLLGVLVLPLMVPALVFGLLAAEAALAGLPVKAYLLLQLAMVIAGLGLLPAAAGFFLNMHLRSS
jgi:heme exporter protein B